MPFHWNQVTWSWLKLMPTGGGGKWRTDGRRNCSKWNARWLRASLPISWGTSRQGAHKSSTENDFFPSLPQSPLCMVICPKQARCPTTTPEEQTPEESETEELPQSAKCLLPAQHQTGKTPLGWVNRKLRAFIQRFPKAPLLGRGWKV